MPKILLVNDDGIKAKGIKALYEVAREFGDIVVVAPASQQSAASHSITIDKPVSYRKAPFYDDVEAYAVSGTPVDSVKMAMNLILSEKPDLLLSGINWGANLGSSVFYSGTMAAAVEGVIHRVPSVAFSLDLDGMEDYSFSQQVVRDILSRFNPSKLPEEMVLNVNIPNIKSDDFAGYSITSQAKSTWKEEYIPHSEGEGEKRYLLSGELINDKEDINADVYVMARNRVSITPLNLNFTDYHAMPTVERLFME